MALSEGASRKTGSVMRAGDGRRTGHPHGAGEGVRHRRRLPARAGRKAGPAPRGRFPVLAKHRGAMPLCLGER